jgi:hypothetical protein
MATRRLFPDLHHLHSVVIPRMTRMPSPIPPVGTGRRARVPAGFRLYIAGQRASGSGNGGTNGERIPAEAEDRPVRAERERTP